MLKHSCYQNVSNIFGKKLKDKRYIKVPEGAIRLANELGILVDLKFYYQLKVINEEGCFKKGSVVPLIQKNYNFSQSSIWRKIKRLSKLGLINKDKNSYHLVRYDKLFEILGYDLTQNNKTKRIGNFKIFKLSLKKIDNLIAYVAKEEIDLNLDRQAYQVWQKIRSNSEFKKLLRKERTQPRSLKDIRGFIDKLYNNSNKVESIENTKQSKIATRYIEESKKHSLKNNSYCNLDITLSNRGIAKLLGFRTTLKGFQLQTLLNKLNLIKSNKRDIFIKTTNQTYKEFRNEFKDPTYRLVDSIIMKRISNKIIIL